MTRYAPSNFFNNTTLPAENGQFSQAVETAEHALKLAEQQRKGVLARALPHEISLYRADLPFHESSR